MPRCGKQLRDGWLRAGAYDSLIQGCVIAVLPAEFGNMKGLEQLYLGRNHLTDLPETIGGMTKLKQLYLPGNRLTRYRRRCARCSHSQWLLYEQGELQCGLCWGSHCRACGVCSRGCRIPHSVTGMRELKDIDLSTNQFAAFPDQLLEVVRSTV